MGCLKLSLWFKGSSPGLVCSIGWTTNWAMPMPGGVNGLMDHLLPLFDINGARGCCLFPERTSILVEIAETISSDSKLVLRVHQYMPDGFGPSCFWSDDLEMPQQAVLNRDIQVLWDTQDSPPATQQLVWMKNVQDLGVWPEDFTFDEFSLWMSAQVAPLPSNQPIHHVEFFAGGFGGWSMANRVMECLSPAKIRTVGIENDPQIAKAFAITHQACFHQPASFMPRGLLSSYDGNWSLCADICDDVWMPALAQWGVHFLTISSPCGPWSGASHAPGLGEPDGQLILKAVLQARFLRPSFIGFENVPGFARHCHKSVLFRVLRFCGYKLVWERIIDVQSKMGISRPRWIALATKVDQLQVASPLQFWSPEVEAPSHVNCVLPWNIDTPGLSVTQENFHLASDSQLYKKHGKDVLAKSTIDFRTYTTEQVLPTFMAKYGTQHLLPRDHLLRYGLMSHFKQESTEWPYAIRHWHPSEIGLLHGAIGQLFLPGDIELAWKIVGNSITTIHSALVIVQIINSVCSLQLTADELLHSFSCNRLSSQTLVTTDLQDGLLLSAPDTLPSAAFVQSISDLFHAVDQDSIWMPNTGKISLAALCDFQPSQDFALAQSVLQDSQIPQTIEVDSSPDECQATCPLIKVVSALFTGPKVQLRFHYAVDIPMVDIERFWFSMVELLPSESKSAEHFAIMTHRSSGVPSVSISGAVAAVLLEQELTFLPADNATPIADHQFMTTLPTDLFDLFGPVNDKQTLNYCTLIISQKLKHGSLIQDISQVFAAFGHSQTSFDWIPETDAVQITISGPEQTLPITATFWQNALPLESLTYLGRKCQVQQIEQKVVIQFLPDCDAGVCPPQLFQVALAIAAFRTLLDSPTLLNEDHGACVQIEWMNRILWEGMLSVQLNMAVLYQLLRFALAPVYSHIPVRLIHKGKQIPFDLQLNEIATLDTNELNKFHIVLALQGGGPSKLQQRVLQQSSIAAILLEHGFDLKWITSTTEKMLSKYSITKLQQVTSVTPGPNRLQAVLNLIQDAGIQLPEPSKPASQKLPMGAPWQPKRRKNDAQLNPMEFRIMPQFFTNQDGSEVLQLDTFQPQATGLALMLPDQAAPFLKGDVLSSDELAIVVLGPLPQQVDMTSKPIRFPALNMDRQMVLLSGHLFQLGAREIQVKEGDPDQIKPEECALVALTMHKSEWSQDDWTQLVSKPIPFLRSIFAKAGFDQAVLSIWGKSLRHGRSPSSPHQAESLQLHCSILASKLHKFLAKSGFNSIYTTPKNADGKLDQTYKVIWVKEDSSSMSVLSMKAPNCLGLVKGSNSLGLRFHQDDHAKAWEVLCPGQDPPKFQTGDLLYKAEGLPFGTTAEMMTTWGSKLQWPVVPIRALGPQSWLLRCSAHPPPGLCMFNSNVVLLRHLPPKFMSSEPVVLGPRASKTVPPAPLRLSDDPWANWKGPRLSDSVSKPVEGPTEARLTAQDEKISTLQKTLEKMSHTQEEFTVATSKRFEEMEQRETSKMKTVTATIEAMRGDIDSSLKQVMQQSTQLMDTRLTELKQMLRQSSKRPVDEDQRMEHWLAPEPLTSYRFRTSLHGPWILYSCLLVLIFLILQPLAFAIAIAILSCRCIRAGSILLSVLPSKQVFRRGPTIALAGGWKAFWIVIFLLPSFAFGASMSQDVFSLQMQPSFCHLLATRVGEASHPGPANEGSQFCNIAITNPTSIVSKFETYQELCEHFSLDLVCAAETAATPLGQKLFGAQLRSIGMKTVWSQPVGEKIVRTDGQQSLRGNASGVAAFSKWPIRPVVGTLTPEMFSTARLVHAVVNLRGVQIQVVVLYGLAAAGTSQQTNALLQEAIRVVELLPLPFLIVGDFNANPWSLPVKDQLSAMGVVDLPMVYSNLRQTAMPPTCKNATKPDNALISLHLQPYLTDVSVLPTPYFDAHNVVVFSLDLEGFQATRMTMPMPAPWSDLSINYDHMSQGYDFAVQRFGQPNSIESWGMVVEEAVDFAYRTTQQEASHLSWSQTQPLPKKYTGRCQPRQPRPAKHTLVTLPSRRGDFNPGEICRKQTRAKIRQVRRIHSLEGRLKKTANVFLQPLDFKQLWDEWHAILRSPCMNQCFIQWCQNIPELGPPPLGLPSLDYVCLLGQFVKHDATSSAAVDAKLLSDMKQFHQYQDSRWCGHAKSFMHLKDNFVAPFEAVVVRHQRDVHVTSNEDGTFQIWCEDPSPFQSHQLLQVEEHSCSLISKDAWSIQVKPIEPVDLTCCCSLSQQVELQEPGEIFARLQAHWAPFWERDDTQMSGQDNFDRLLDLIPDDWEPPQVDMQDISLWTQAIKDLKTPFARGVDAISSWELKKLPLEAIKHLRDVLLSYTAGFPAWFLRALTAPVPKIPETPEVSQIRPITILSQLYRVWSRVLCRQLLAHLSARMPPQLTGLLATRGPLDASMRQQFFLETCHYRGDEASGLSLDLIKCFNTISRPRVFALLQKLQFPAAEINQWYASIQQMTRFWTYQGWCSSLTDTSCGLPEGDTFSVVCMVVIDYLWILGILANTDDPFLSAYADNIGWATTQLAEHDHMIPFTLTFAECFGMAIDWAKTWIWGSTPHAAKRLQECLQRHVPHAVIAIRRAAMDLGSQLNYSGPPVLGQFRKRIDKATKRLRRLRTMKLPLKSKVLMLQGGIYPVLLYGIALLPLGTTHFDTLRPLCADGLLGHSASRNSAIAISATPGASDPMVQALIVTVHTVRRFLHHLSAAEQALFFEMTARHSGRSTQVQGPAGALKYWLGKLGWSVTRQGLVDVQTFCQVSLLTTSNASFARWIQKEWQTEVFQFHCRRAALSFLQIDLMATRRLIQTFAPQQQPALINELAGAYQTEHQKQHWASDADGNCRHCSLPDSRFHRLHECPATADVRLPYMATLAALQEDGSLLHELPAIHLDQEVDVLVAVHYRHVEATVAPSLLQRIHDMILQGLQPHFYTDGSLQFPEDPHARHAAYAMVIDLCTDDSQRYAAVRQWSLTGRRPSTFATLACARTTGEQRIHRSELYGILRICELFSSATIFSDSNSAISVFDKCLVASHPGKLQTLEDFDLVERLWHAVQRGTHAVHKVKAHVTHAHSMSFLQCYHSWGNEAANEAAIDTCLHMYPDVVQTASRLYEANQCQRDRLKQILSLQLELHHVRAMLDSNREVQLPHEQIRAAGPPQAKVLAELKLSQVRLNPEIKVSNIAMCAWGEVLSRLMVSWMKEFKWPSQESLSLDDPGITFMELMLSWRYYTGLLPPVKRFRGDKDEFLQPLEHAGDVELHSVTFSELATTMACWIAQVRKLLRPDPWPEFSHGPCRSLYRLGAGIQSRGITTRPEFPFQERVVDTLARYIRTHTDFAVVPPLLVGEIPSAARAQIRFPWDQLRRTSSRGATLTRSSSGMQTLRFRWPWLPFFPWMTFHFADLPCLTRRARVLASVKGMFEILPVEATNQTCCFFKFAQVSSPTFGGDERPFTWSQVNSNVDGCNLAHFQDKGSSSPLCLPLPSGKASDHNGHPDTFDFSWYQSLSGNWSARIVAICQSCLFVWYCLACFLPWTILKHRVGKQTTWDFTGSGTL